VEKNNKTRFFYVLYCFKTWVFDQSECAQGPIYIIIKNKPDFEPSSLINRGRLHMSPEIGQAGSVTGMNFVDCCYEKFLALSTGMKFKRQNQNGGT